MSRSTPPRYVSPKLPFCGFLRVLKSPAWTMCGVQLDQGVTRADPGCPPASCVALGELPQSTPAGSGRRQGKVGKVHIMY